MAWFNSLESESIFIIRESYSKIRNLALLWSMGKDSTVLLHLVRKAFLGRIPIPLVHIDTGYDIPALLDWRDDFARCHQLKLIIGQNREALASGMGPTKGAMQCCTALKTQALINTVNEHKIGGLLVGIRRDEEGSRSKERVVSPRTQNGAWSYKEQPAEVWQYYNLHLPNTLHLRVHPLLNWTEVDIWQYIRQENLEIPTLYFSQAGERYRSLGCLPCTKQSRSEANSIDTIIQELLAATESERSGRAQDKTSEYAMQELRKLGHM